MHCLVVILNTCIIIIIITISFVLKVHQIQFDYIIIKVHNIQAAKELTCETHGDFQVGTNLKLFFLVSLVF